MAVAGDPVWIQINDCQSFDADLRLADAGKRPRCDQRYDGFIERVVF